MAEHEPASAQLRLEIRARDAGLEGRELREPIERDQATHPRHSNRERRSGSVSGRKMTDDACRAADRDRNGAGGDCKLKRLPDLVFALGEGHAVDNRT